jgi:hypothetical protein
MNTVCKKFLLYSISALMVFSLSYSQQPVVESEKEKHDQSAVDKVVGSKPSGVTEVLASTHLDRPGEFHKDFGMQPGSKLAKTLRALSKIDLDGDLDYDGTLDNTAEVGQGAREYVPPGLQIGVGEMTKLVVRYKTYENDFPGELYVTLEVAGINRFAATGAYAKDAEELESTGRIRVWKSPKKEVLFLDSGDLAKRVFEWKVDKKLLKTGLPGTLPRVLYVEGVKESKTFEGDLRLLISSSHSLSEGENRSPSGIYRTAYDHILFTVLEEPVEKAFINNNAEGVWLFDQESEKSE